MTLSGFLLLAALLSSKSDAQRIRSFNIGFDTTESPVGRILRPISGFDFSSWTVQKGSIFEPGTPVNLQDAIRGDFNFLQACSQPNLASISNAGIQETAGGTLPGFKIQDPNINSFDLHTLCFACSTKLPDASPQSRGNPITKSVGPANCLLRIVGTKKGGAGQVATVGVFFPGRTTILRTLPPMFTSTRMELIDLRRSSTSPPTTPDRGDWTNLESVTLRVIRYSPTAVDNGDLTSEAFDMLQRVGFSDDVGTLASIHVDSVSGRANLLQ